MRWETAPKLRADLVAFAGLNLSGERRVIEFHPVGGRQGELNGEDLKSLAFVAPVGTRLILMASADPEDWMRHPWRAIKILPGSHFLTKEGKPCVRIPDIDFLDAFDARRTDPELQSWYDEADSLDATGWTYGRVGPLKGNVKAIKIDRF